MGKRGPYTREEEQATGTDTDISLEEKDFKLAIINMSKEPKKQCLKNQRRYDAMPHQKEMLKKENLLKRMEAEKYDHQNKKITMGSIVGLN